MKNKNDLLKDPFFKGLDWNKILNKEIPPPKLASMEDDDIEMPMVNKFFSLILIILKYRVQQEYSVIRIIMKETKMQIELKTLLSFQIFKKSALFFFCIHILIVHRLIVFFTIILIFWVS